MLAGLDQHPVAGGQGVHRRQQGQVPGVVEGGDDADHPQGLAMDPGAAWLEPPGHGGAAGPHPAAQVALGMADRLQHGGDLGQAALRLGAVAEILGDGPTDLLAVAAGHGRQTREPVAAEGQVGPGLGGEGAALGIEPCLQRLDMSHAALPEMYKAGKGSGTMAPFRYGIISPREPPCPSSCCKCCLPWRRWRPPTGTPWRGTTTPSCATNSCTPWRPAAR